MCGYCHSGTRTNPTLGQQQKLQFGIPTVDQKKQERALVGWWVGGWVFPRWTNNINIVARGRCAFIKYPSEMKAEIAKKNGCKKDSSKSGNEMGNSVYKKQQ